ncbi:MAG: hypothetical protein MUF54_21280, partial [Polyangiaceae bacterium]|nr:hypothetical protein [Polyangiaceae bacterium]
LEHKDLPIRNPGLPGRSLAWAPGEALRVDHIAGKLRDGLREARVTRSKLFRNDDNRMHPGPRPACDVRDAGPGRWQNGRLGPDQDWPLLIQHVCEVPPRR